MVQHEGWIYYSNQEKGGIYRQSIDGLRLEKLNDAKSDYINIVGNMLFKYTHGGSFHGIS